MTGLTAELRAENERLRARLRTVTGQLEQCIAERNFRIEERVAAEARLEAVTALALLDHREIATIWGGEQRSACRRCRYGDGVPYLWPCPTRQALTGEPAPDPLPQDPVRRAAVEAKVAPQPEPTCGDAR